MFEKHHHRRNAMRIAVIHFIMLETISIGFLIIFYGFNSALFQLPEGLRTTSLCTSVSISIYPTSLRPISLSSNCIWQFSLMAEMSGMPYASPSSSFFVFFLLLFFLFFIGHHNFPILVIFRCHSNAPRLDPLNFYRPRISRCHLWTIGDHWRPLETIRPIFMESSKELLIIPISRIQIELININSMRKLS